MNIIKNLCIISIYIKSLNIYILFYREFRDENGQFDNNYGSSEYRNGSNWNNSKGNNDGGRFSGFNNPKGSSNYRGGSSYDFNSSPNGGFKHQRSRWSSENTDESWNGTSQDPSNMINGPPPISQGGTPFGENQIPQFNEQDNNIQPGGPPSNQLPSLLQVYIHIVKYKEITSVEKS